jgi:hypothetical protein
MLETGGVISSIIRSKKDWNSPQNAVTPLKKMIDKEGIFL